MNNADKQYLSALERRIFKLEAIIEQMVNGIYNGQAQQSYCNQCGRSYSEGMTCSMANCPQGLNPADDKKEK